MVDTSIWVEGTPTAQPRPRATIRKGRVHVYNKNTANLWKDCIKLAFKDYINYETANPISIQITYYLKRPKTLLRKKDIDGVIKHTKKPDIDNLNKAVLDAITDIRLWKDDSQVYTISATKYYTYKTNNTIGAKIHIKEH